ncbi:MAG: hypothetical protein Aurels2KO_34950 [Aureliella sp.]
METLVGGLVSWIYRLHEPTEIAARVQEAHRRVSESGQFWFRKCTDGDQIVAAAYFLRLPGRVATLGGVRAIEGAESTAALQLEELAEEALGDDVVQCQGVSSAGDEATKNIVRRSGFKWLTQVAHIYLDLQAHQAEGGDAENQTRFRPARDFSTHRVAKLVADTFVDSRDCPELDGIRSELDVLDGFLDGTSLRSTDRWEVAEVSGQPSGVLLVNDAGGGASELSYFGVPRFARGRGMGRQLLERAILLSKSRGDSILAAAVDQRNVPALRTYDHFGFKHHQSLDVWLHQSHCEGCASAQRRNG